MATEESSQLLSRAMDAWNALSRIRKERARNLRYRNGDQWSDYMEDPENRGHAVREEELLVREGKMPLKHNFIQQFIRNVSGQMISNPSQSVVYTRTEEDRELSEMLTNTLQACAQLNQNDRLNIIFLEELLLAGIACSKIRYGFWHTKGVSDGIIDNVNINRLFFNSDIEDPRLFDLRIIGEIHDFTIDEIVCNYARSAADEARLREIYSRQNGNDGFSRQTGRDMKRSKVNELNFIYPQDESKCRVIEVWEKKARWITLTHDYESGCELVDKENKGRGIVSQNGNFHTEERYEYYWLMTCLAPNGEVLLEKESPYKHGEHPYVLTTLPLIDGTVNSLLSDIIDIQKYINRLIVMIDFIMGSSAKGVLMVPENAIPDGMSISDFTNEYVKANGVIVYKPNATRDAPYQITSNSTNVGAWEMLNLQMNMINQISGLSGAIQGERPHSNMPSSLYTQQAQNSQLNYRVLFDTLRIHQQRSDEKLLKVLMQYYTTTRYLDVSGTCYGKTALVYEPEMAKTITNFNLVVTQSLDTPVYRQIIDDSLKHMLDARYIDIEMYLTNSSLPFAEKLLAQIRAKKNAE